jgi:hypothetical protein
LQDSQITIVVQPYHFSFLFKTIMKDNCHSIGFSHNMIVRDNVTIFIENEPRTSSLATQSLVDKYLDIDHTWIEMFI